MWASKNGHLGIAQLLVERGANVNAARTTDGCTALMWASQSGHLGIAQLLVERGANLNAAATDDGYTALMSAIQEGHLSIAQLLVERGANVLTVGRGLIDDYYFRLSWGFCFPNS